MSPDIRYFDHHSCSRSIIIEDTTDSVHLDVVVWDMSFPAALLGCNCAWRWLEWLHISIDVVIFQRSPIPEQPSFKNKSDLGNEMA